MKYIIVIADGGADFPIEQLGGRTPFAAAKTPNLDRLAASGMVGTVVTTPRGFEAGSDVCSMDLLGYDPARYHTGRAPLEAAAMGLKLEPSDWIFRVNFVTVGAEGTPDAGLMIDHSAGALTREDGIHLVCALMDHWRDAHPELTRGMRLEPGVSYRNILIDSCPGPNGSASGCRRDYRAVHTRPPHEIPRQPIVEHLPRPVVDSDEARAAAAAMIELMASAPEALATHPVNVSRVAEGKRPANSVWIWGQGVRPMMPLFRERFGLRGAMTTAVDLLAGIAVLIGWDRLKVPGLSSYHDNDYAAQGRATADALDNYDIVCCHVESPDEASHQGDWKTKVAAVEAIDEEIIGPVIARARERYSDGWRLLVMPDHYTLTSTRKHDPTAVPWMIAGTDVPSSGSGQVRFTESDAARGQAVARGPELMDMFINGMFPGSETAK